MAPFDRSCTTFYWSAIVNIALSGTVFELFHVEWYRNCEIWVRGHSRSFKPVPFESLGAVSYSLSIVTMALSCIISEIKRDIGRKWWFFHTPLHSTPPFRGFLSEYCHPVWYGKTRMVGLTDGEKSLRIFITVYTQYRRVTDRLTDGQTDILSRHSSRYAYASRVKNGLASSVMFFTCLPVRCSAYLHVLRWTIQLMLVGLLVMQMIKIYKMVEWIEGLAATNTMLGGVW